MMLKKLLLIGVLATGLFAASINWAPNYKEAVELAKKENKPIMLMLSQPGCPACIQMKDVIFKGDELLANEINTKFIPVEVNILKDDWNKKFRAFATPTFYFIDKNENKIGRQFVGGAEAADFMKILKDIEKQRKF
jgi:thioredoxin-related protein